MRIVMLMRHAKSDWGAGVAADHDRPLAPRGEDASARLGRFLSASGNPPDLILSSTAERARTTAEIAAAAGGWGCGIELESVLYHGGTEEAIEVIRRTDPAIRRLLLVGHNPTWEMLASQLNSGGDFRFPTAAVACLRFAGADWADAGPGRAELLWFVIPRLLG